MESNIFSIHMPVPFGRQSRPEQPAEEVRMSGRMKDFNIPIQAITVCSTVGDFTPLRFRYEDSEHQLQSVKISRVIASKATVYGGINCLQYTCAAEMEGQEHFFILKYNVLTHTWIFFKMLS